MTEQHKQTVFDTYLRAAQGARKEGFPINPVAAAAQACHETGFGASTPPGSNNVLGIKAGKHWTGPTVNAKTHEYYQGERVDGIATNWRVYPTVQACFQDYGSIINGLWWYKDAHAHADGDPFDYLTALKPIYGPDGKEVLEPGYFTDPRYVVNVMKIVRQYHITTPAPSEWSLVVIVGDTTHVFEIPEGYDVVERISFEKKRRYVHIRRD